ncbi:MAG: 16S rRNA (cytosine(1402)-N(4))-methyltransferase RsmH [Candidatus Saccharimonadales bacterium]
MHQNQNKNKHIPVLLEQVIKCLDPQPGESYLDLTAGYGGHAEAVLALTKNPKGSVLVDRDENAIEALKPLADTGAILIHKDFLSASTELLEAEVQFDLILADLGISSPHIDNASRGFAISLDGPLDMRMDLRQTLSAQEIVNTYSEEDLRNLIRNYGEDRQAGRIAKAIISARPLGTTKQLADIIESAVGKRGKTHPATKTFQALRIVVNDELRLIRESLPVWFDLLAPGGRIVVISFHSLEDRLVKQALAEVGGNTYDARLRIITKRPLSADTQELAFNPRARSAKLRAAAKIKIERELTDANTRQK